eukprot:4776493-Prymnesium_polylepis.2
MLIETTDVAAEAHSATGQKRALFGVAIFSAALFGACVSFSCPGMRHLCKLSPFLSVAQHTQSECTMST